MADTFDVVVIGGGVMGASAVFHLKKLGAERVVLLERKQICTGGSAKSCAIVRTHYSIPSNTALAIKGLEIFRHFTFTYGQLWYRLYILTKRSIAAVQHWYLSCQKHV